MSLTNYKPKPHPSVDEAAELAGSLQRRLFMAQNKILGISKDSDEDKLHMTAKDWITRLQTGQLRICVATPLEVVTPNRHIAHLLNKDDRGDQTADVLLVDVDLGSWAAEPTTITNFIAHVILPSGDGDPKILKQGGGMLVMISATSGYQEASLAAFERVATGLKVPVLTLVDGAPVRLALSKDYPALSVTGRSPESLALALLSVGKSISDSIRLIAGRDDGAAEECMAAVTSTLLLKHSEPL